MNIELRCFIQTGVRQQHGFDLANDEIRRLAPLLAVPSTKYGWSDLFTWLQALDRGQRVRPYTREWLVFDGKQQARTHLMIARPGPQSFVNAPTDTWLWDYVDVRHNSTVIAEYVVGAYDEDLLVLPSGAATAAIEFKAVEDPILAAIQTKAKPAPTPSLPPPDAKAVGLHFELAEYELRVKALPAPRHRVLHRHPSLISALALLRQNDISCDIDVEDTTAGTVQCVEVKSVTGAPGAPFLMTPKELQSRTWCAANGIDYEIVVYYHYRLQVVERRVIRGNQALSADPISYSCRPP